MEDKEKIFNLSELIDVNSLQEFQDMFARMTGFASIAVDDNGSITKPSNFTEFCIKHTRGSAEGLKRCLNCDIECGKMAAKTKLPVIYTCHSGLTDFAVPIVVDGVHVGSILGGQILTAPPDEAHFRQVAKELGIDEDKYLEALKKIKIMPFSQVKAAADLLFFVANTISKISHKNYELHRSEEYISAIFESINDGIFVINNDYVIESCNSSVKNMWGFSADELIGKSIKSIFKIDFDVKLCENRFGALSKISQAIRKDGSTFQIFINPSKIDLNGRKLVLLSVRDMTEQNKIDTMKSEFVSTVSHELRTPLTSIKGSLGLVKSGVLGDLPQKAKEMIDIADNNCSRLTNLINDILDLEKIKAGKYEFKHEEVEVNSVLEQAVVLNQSYADQFGMKLIFKKTFKECYISADKNRLLQVLSNLLSNAVKFSKMDSIVNVGAILTEGKVKFSVSDNGIGISDDFKHKVFQSFSQEDSSDSRAKGGTGLGLSISKLIIEKMGGEIGFDSELDKGSTFYFVFPSIEKGSLAFDTGEIKPLEPETDAW